MQLGIAAQAAAVLEQPRIVGGDALEQRLDRALAAAIPTLSRERLKALIRSGAHA